MLIRLLNCYLHWRNQRRKRQIERLDAKIASVREETRLTRERTLRLFAIAEAARQMSESELGEVRQWVAGEAGRSALDWPGWDSRIST